MICSCYISEDFNHRKAAFFLLKPNVMHLTCPELILIIKFTIPLKENKNVQMQVYTPNFQF